MAFHPDILASPSNKKNAGRNLPAQAILITVRRGRGIPALPKPYVPRGVLCRQSGGLLFFLQLFDSLFQILFPSGMLVKVLAIYELLCGFTSRYGILKR